MSRFVLNQMYRVVGCSLIVVFGLSAAGCLSYPERQDFGDAVKNMQLIQTTSPRMRVAPEDGNYAGAVLEAYRADVASPKQVQNEITINVGTGGQ